MRKGRKGVGEALARYAVPRVVAAAWMLAVGAAACVTYNVIHPRGLFSLTKRVHALGPRDRSSAPGRTAVIVHRIVPGPLDAGGKAGDGKDSPPLYEMKVIGLAEATTYLASGDATFVDARSAQRFGMGHVPGAISVPSSDFAASFAREESRLPRKGIVIVYCESASCDQAEEVGKGLLSKGYQHVLHFKDGWILWEVADQPQETGAGR